MIEHNILGMNKSILFVVGLLFLGTISLAQMTFNGSFGKGLRFETEDKTFYCKFGVRVQPRWDYVYTQSEMEVDGFSRGHFEQQAWIARGRIKFDGYMMNPDFRYKIEFDVVGGYVRDAMAKYRLNSHSDFWFGQGKLPGNRERVISSGNLQFVNRSITNNAFNIDRDVGVQFHHNFKIGNVVIKDMYAVTTGNGIRDKRFKPKPSITAKIEVMPFGNFSGKKGAYISQDFEREQKVKLAIAFSADYNMESYKTHSHIGSSFANATRDLLTLNGDFLLKYKGISWLTEVGHRQIGQLDGGSRTAVVYDGDSENVIGAYYTGWGINTQMGYLFKNQWEVAVRYAMVRPDALNNEFTGDPILEYTNQTNYVLCLSKYLVKNKLKIQADVTYGDIDSNLDTNPDYIQDVVQGRLQMEIHF